MKYFLISLLTLLCLSCGENEPKPAAETVTYSPVKSLETASSFPVGVATQASYLDDASYSQIVDQEFNSLSAEYEMKQRTFHSGPNTYNWGPADKMVNYAKANNMRVHGHALIWHQSVPTWLENFSGTDAEFTEIIKNYIQETVGRYKGDVASWDVVNEAFDDEGNWRNSIFRERMGDDYIAQCFQFAREADSSAVLFYNEYGTIWDSRKLNDMLTMIDDLQNRGIPIDGVGFQMHITYNWPSISQIRAAVNEIVNRGLVVHFSEVDIRVNPDGDLAQLTQERAEDQQLRLKTLTEMYLEIPEAQQFGFTFWGLRDNESWLIDFWGNPEWPLLFTEEYGYKFAHKGFIEAFE